jgi:hypothetical protein
MNKRSSVNTIVVYVSINYMQFPYYATCFGLLTIITRKELRRDRASTARTEWLYGAFVNALHKSDKNNQRKKKTEQLTLQYDPTD